MKKIKIIVWGILKRISMGLSTIIFLYFFIGSPMMISGESMEPNFHDKELCWIDKITYLFSEPKRGDIVVFRFPGTRNDLYIKRIIGLPNETIEIKNNNIYINNKLLQEVYISGETPSKGFLKLKLKENEFFVLGDNRKESNDSRIWGPLDKKFIIGKLNFVFLPLSERGYIFPEGYNF